MTPAALAGRVLLVSSDDGRLDGIEADLVDAGYDVRRCLRGQMSLATGWRCPVTFVT